MSLFLFIYNSIICFINRDCFILSMIFLLINISLVVFFSVNDSKLYKVYKHKLNDEQKGKIRNNIFASITVGCILMTLLLFGSSNSMSLINSNLSIKDRKNHPISSFILAHSVSIGEDISECYKQINLTSKEIGKIVVNMPEPEKLLKYMNGVYNRREFDHRTIELNDDYTYDDAKYNKSINTILSKQNVIKNQIKLMYQYSIKLIIIFIIVIFGIINEIIWRNEINKHIKRLKENGEYYDLLENKNSLE